MTPRRALIIEDDEEVRTLLLRLLRSFGFSAVAVGSAESAFAWLDMNAAPDLVTVDLRLPGLSGLAVCDRLRGASATAAVPIIVVTGSTSAADHQAVAARGAVWLAKPFDVAAYRDAVDALVPPLPVTRSSRPQGVYFSTARAADSR